MLDATWAHAYCVLKSNDGHLKAIREIVRLSGLDRRQVLRLLKRAERRQAGTYKQKARGHGKWRVELTKTVKHQIRKLCHIHFWGPKRKMTLDALQSIIHKKVPEYKYKSKKTLSKVLRVSSV